MWNCETVMMRRRCVTKSLAPLILICLLLLLGGELHAQSATQPVLWLPLITTAATIGEPSEGNSNPVHDGIATYYGATGAGACLFDPSPDDLMVAAVNAEQFDTAALCGAYVQVDGPDGTIVVRIVDRCPECEAGHLDLSQEAFALIAEPIRGIVPIRWQIISPEIDGTIAYHFKDGSNQWWTAVQIRNHRNPIASVEYFDGSEWVSVSRTAYNFFVQTDPGMGPGPYQFRVTDIYGNNLTDSNIPHIENGTVAGNGQFPAGP